MFIKVISRSQAVDALLRGETLWSLTTGEGWQLDLSAPGWKSKRAVRRFIGKLQTFWDKPHEFALRR